MDEMKVHVHIEVDLKLTEEELQNWRRYYGPWREDVSEQRIDLYVRERLIEDAKEALKKWYDTTYRFGAREA